MFAFSAGSALKPEARLALCAELLDAASRGPLTPVRYSRWLRERQVSERETGAFLRLLLGLGERGPIEAGPGSEELRTAMAAKGGAQGEDFRQALFERLLELDGYMARTLFSALKETNGLISERELYARVAAPGYRGQRWPNVAVNNWLTWMASLGATKSVGFQRKLTPMGEAGLAYLEGILEEELLAPQDGQEPANGEPGTEPAPDEPDEQPDTTAAAPAGPVSPSAPVAQAAPALPERTQLDPDTLVAAPPEVHEEAAPASYSPYYNSFSEGIPHDPARERNARRVLAWWHSCGAPAPGRAQALGIEIGSFAKKARPRTLHALFSAARCLAAGEEGLVLWEALRTDHRIAALFDEELTLDDLLEGDLGASPAAGLLVDLVRFRARLRDGGAEALERAGTTEALLRALQRVAGDTLGPWLFWVPRELRLAGHWRIPQVERLCCVPTETVRQHAYRLDLLPTHYARDTQELAEAARLLSVWFRTAECFDLPLAHFARSYGCAFHCDRVQLCALDCNEKLDRGDL